MTPPFRPRPLRGLLALALLGLGTQAAVGAPAHGDRGVSRYLFAVYQGDCANPTVEATFRLGETHPAGADPGDDDDLVDVRGSANAEPVATGAERLDATFETLLGEQPKVVAVYRDPYEPDAILACGELGGIVDDGRLVVGLRPVGNSGVAGIAIFEEEEGFLGLGEDEVTVTVYLLDGLGGPDQGEPAARPTTIAPTG